MEPNYMTWMENQAFFRINRYGQMAEKTYAYRLYSKDSKVELVIINRQARRKAFQDTTYDENGQEMGGEDVEEANRIVDGIAFV
jgi:hypothetical protein